MRGWPPCRRPRLARLLFTILLDLLLLTPAVAEPEQLPALVAEIRAEAQAISGGASDYDALLASIGEARLVMLGEATHGSAEFYEERARITQRLISEKGFSGLVLEAGWAPAMRVDAFVRGRLPGPGADQALRAFRHFPRWVWRNAEFAAFLERLRTLNAGSTIDPPPISVYGMDLYGVPEAIDEVVGYLRASDPQAAARAKRAYRCFAPYLRLDIDPQLYGRDVARGSMPSCARKVRAQVAHLARRQRLSGGDPAAFAARMSARSIAGAEAYYRTLYTAGALVSWNQRERFLAGSLQILLERHPKLVVWAHNTHQGDARATDQARVGELSIGQLLRQALGWEAVYLVGMTTFSGSVRAATGWATPDREQELLPAIAGSWSAVLHEVGLPAFLLVFRDHAGLSAPLDRSLPDRGVGVTYLPAAERENHYTDSSPARRFDALIHIDRTRAVLPLRRGRQFTAKPGGRGPGVAGSG